MSLKSQQKHHNCQSPQECECSIKSLVNFFKQALLSNVLVLKQPTCSQACKSTLIQPDYQICFGGECYWVWVMLSIVLDRSHLEVHSPTISMMTSFLQCNLILYQAKDNEKKRRGSDGSLSVVKGPFWGRHQGKSGV